MAIYKNREVQVVGPSPMANTPSTINISYRDGTHENVKLSDIRFTEGEKKSLIKNYPSKYDNVELITEEDLKAVRVGVAPTYDKTVIEQAKVQAQHEKQVELASKRAEEAKAQQKKELEKTQENTNVSGR